MQLLNHSYQAECPIDQIRTHERNARQGDAGAIYQSIEANGFYGAVVAQLSSRKILAGNHRYLTAVSLEATTIPVLWVDCDDATALRILLADNRTSDLGDYDMPALADLLDSVRMDNGLSGTGWDDDSFQNLLEDLKGIELGDMSGGEVPVSAKKEEKSDDVVRPEVFDGPNPTVPSKSSTDEEPAPAPVQSIKDKFQVLVECVSEQQQTEVLELLQPKGYVCRALVA